jgi:hypothetical protein
MSKSSKRHKIETLKGWMQSVVIPKVKVKVKLEDYDKWSK